MEKDSRISSWMEEHRQQLLEDLKTLCRVDSVSGPAQEGAPYGPGPKAALEAAMEMCAGYGLAVENHGDRVMTADMGPEEPCLDMLAHLDVVGPGDGWDTDPFEPELKEDGYLYGRGVADDKGGAVAALYAMRCVKELGLPLKGRCRLILGTDEENGSSDVAWYYERVKPAPMTFTPDTDFPVCNGEKGFYRLRFSKQWEQEFASPRVTELHGGFRVNVVPGEAYAIIVGMDREKAANLVGPVWQTSGGFLVKAQPPVSVKVEDAPGGVKITAVGKGCHAAMPETGGNANTALLQVLSGLPLADCGSTRAIRALAKALPHGDFYGKALGIAQEDEVTGRLTCSFTQIDVTSAGLKGLCDCRVPVCANEGNCKAVADAKLRGQGFATEGEMIPPHYTPAEGEFIQTLNRCYETYSGREGGCYSMGGGTYVHDVPGGVAFGVVMPGEDVRMHGANERIKAEDLITAAQIFAQAVADLCGEKQ